MKEKELFDIIQLNNPDSILFRNDNGMGFVGNNIRYASKDTIIKLKKGEYVLINPKKIKYGLYKGSGDLIGWTEKIITKDMIGKKVAVFTSIEAKTKGDRISKDQIKWDKNVNNSGGISKVCYESEL